MNIVNFSRLRNLLAINARTKPKATKPSWIKPEIKFHNCCDASFLVWTSRLDESEMKWKFLFAREKRKFVRSMRKKKSFSNSFVERSSDENSCSHIFHIFIAFCLKVVAENFYLSHDHLAFFKKILWTLRLNNSSTTLLALIQRNVQTWRGTKWQIYLSKIMKIQNQPLSKEKENEIKFSSCVNSFFWKKIITITTKPWAWFLD